MSTLIHERVAQCQAGTNPKTIGRTQSGWVVIGDTQFLRGYCLLLPDPVVPDLNALTGTDRAQFMSDWVALGDVLLAATDAVRINYEILGNLEPALHAHTFPRYADEPEELRTKPVWIQDWDAAPFDHERDAPLMATIRRGLEAAGVLRD